MSTFTQSTSGFLWPGQLPVQNVMLSLAGAITPSDTLQAFRTKVLTLAGALSFSGLANAYRLLTDKILKLAQLVKAGSLHAPVGIIVRIKAAILLLGGGMIPFGLAKRTNVRTFGGGLTLQGIIGTLNPTQFLAAGGALSPRGMLKKMVTVRWFAAILTYLGLTAHGATIVPPNPVDSNNEPALPPPVAVGVGATEIAAGPAGIRKRGITST
jgi:hypothetical protein